MGWAASFGQLDAVRALIECGADPLRPANKAGNTPLSDAKRERHAHVVTFLEQYSKVAGNTGGGGAAAAEGNGVIHLKPTARIVSYAAAEAFARM